MPRFTMRWSSSGYEMPASSAAAAKSSTAAQVGVRVRLEHPDATVLREAQVDARVAGEPERAIGALRHLRDVSRQCFGKIFRGAGADAGAQLVLAIPLGALGGDRLASRPADCRRRAPRPGRSGAARCRAPRRSVRGPGCTARRSRRCRAGGARTRRARAASPRRATTDAWEMPSDASSSTDFTMRG